MRKSDMDEIDAHIQKSLDQKLKDNLLEVMVKICRTAALAILGMATWMGSLAVSHSERLEKAIRILIGYGDPK